MPFVLISLAEAFEHEQALHAKGFRGESELFCTILWLSVYACRISCYSLLIFIGIKISWLVAIGMFIGGFIIPGLLAGLIATTMARVFGAIGQAIVSMAGFLVWPASLIAAYLTLPKIG